MSTAQTSETCADPITLNEFMNSLHRLFKIGIYYPTGHVILDKATDRCMGQLVAIAGDNPSVRLDNFGSSLMLEGIELDAGQPYFQDFKELFTALGITAVMFDRETTRQELHDFVRKMLAYKSKALSAKQFTQIEVSELPHSISVILKEFLAREDSSISDDRAGESAENLDSFINSLSNYGLSGDEISSCKILLESLPERLTDSSIEINDLPYATWDDVARLLSRAVKSKHETGSELKNEMAGYSNINALASILKKLERETTDIKSRETINLLVSIIRKPVATKKTDTDEAVDVGSRIFPETPDISITQLQEYTTKNRLHPKILTNIPESPIGQETLSILMQLARYEQSLPSQIHMQQLFRELLSSPVNEKSWEILSRGLHQIAKEVSAVRISSVIRLIVEPLRRSVHANPLHLLLLTLQHCNKKEALIFWPFVVNEILVNGSSADQISYYKLCQFAAGIEPKDMNSALPQLQSLDSFQSNAVAPDIFHALTPRCYPLFAFLLRTDIEQFISERVIGGLRRSSPDWLIKAVIPLLDTNKQEHRLFLYSYLREASRKILPATLKQVAAKIIAETLPALPQDRRQESWVQETIAALSQLQTAETRALLDEIAGKKKLLFIPEWPSECRKTAEAVITSSKRRR